MRPDFKVFLERRPNYVLTNDLAILHYQDAARFARNGEVMRDKYDSHPLAEIQFAY